MQDLTIFISSSDKYEDCWMPFFTMFKRKWKDCECEIILNTEQKKYAIEGLNIKCTQVGKHSYFGETFHAGLNTVKTKYVLLIMIDYVFMDTVYNENIKTLYHHFKTLDLDALYFVNQEDSFKGYPSEIDGILYGDKISKDRFSFQIGLWKTKTLPEYVLKHEDPWMAEKFGAKRGNILNHKIAFVSKQLEPINYLATGVLHKGGWITEIKSFFDKEAIHIDYSKRGFYKNIKPSIIQKIIAKKNRSWGEFKSWLHLKKLILVN